MKAHRTGWLVGAAAVSLAAGAVVGGFVDLAAALALLLLATSPYLVRAYLRALASAPVSMTPGFGGWVLPPAHVLPEYERIVPAPTARVVSDEQLRFAWATSFQALQARPSASQVVATVEERQRFLDEFERRNPGGFAAWLSSDAGVSNIPACYLRDGRATPSELNWDELTREQDS